MVSGPNTAMKAALMTRTRFTGRVGGELDAELQLPGALLQQFDIGGNDYIARPIAGGDGETEVGPDAGRLAGSNGNQRQVVSGRHGARSAFVEPVVNESTIA